MLSREMLLKTANLMESIGALRHVIEFVCYRRLARREGHVDESGTEWREMRCGLALALEQQNSDLPLLLLSAEYLGVTDRLDEARDRGYRAFNTNSRCLLTQHVLDCVRACAGAAIQENTLYFLSFGGNTLTFYWKVLPCPV